MLCFILEIMFNKLIHPLFLQNVLEGIGLLVKRGKNHVSWNENPPETAAQAVAQSGGAKGDSDSDGIPSPPKLKPKKVLKNSAEYEEMKHKLEKLKEEERQVDKYLEYLKEQAAVFNGRQPPSQEQIAYIPEGVGNVPEQMYVAFEDITNMPSYKSETVIGIRAPTGTSLEVPDPDQGMKPGQRRFEMYLSSKGTEHPGMRGSSQEKGEPINVYLVQPRADQQARPQEKPSTADGEQSPSPTRSSKQAPEKEPEQSQGENPAQHPEQSPSRGRPDHRYERHDYEHNSHHDDRSHHGHHEHYPPPDSSWGPPVPYGYPPPGYYPPSGYDHHGYPPYPHEEGVDHGQDLYLEAPPEGHHEAFRPRSSSHHYYAHEMGRTASSGGEAPPPPPRPNSPSSHLLNMPLQSPHETFDPPPSAGFTPPGGPRESVRVDNPDLPMPTLPAREGSQEHRDQSWQPPHPKMQKKSQSDSGR